jgi:hypothetical protein
LPNNTVPCCKHSPFYHSERSEESGKPAEIKMTKVNTINQKKGLLPGRGLLLKKGEINSNTYKLLLEWNTV